MKKVWGPQNLPQDLRSFGRFCRSPNSLHMGFRQYVIRINKEGKKIWEINQLIEKLIFLLFPASTNRRCLSKWWQTPNSFAIFLSYYFVFFFGFVFYVIWPTYQQAGDSVAGCAKTSSWFSFIIGCFNHILFQFWPSGSTIKSSVLFSLYCSVHSLENITDHHQP